MFSVVIPLYNKENFIKRTLTSVLNQTFSDFEVIIVNDSSSDSSLKLVEEFKDNRVKVFTKANGGVSAARNFGINKSTHEIIAFLDADDVWLPDYLSTIYQLVSRYPEAGMFVTGYYSEKDGKKQYANHISKYPQFSILDDYFKVSYNHGLSINITSATCVRRDVLLSTPMFREKIKRGEDIDVWLRVALRHPVAFCNEAKMIYLVGSPNSLSVNYTKSNEDFPYWDWLQYSSRSPFYRKYVVLADYIFAKNAFENRDYKSCLFALKKIWNVKPFVKPLKRLYLLVISSFKVLFS